MTKRIFATVLAVAMLCTMFAITSSANASGKKVFTYDAEGADYGWYGFLAAVNTNPSPDADFKAAGTAYSTVLNALVAIMSDPAQGTTASATYVRNYAMDGGLSLYYYTEDVYGAQCYGLRGGRMLAMNYWNENLPEYPIATNDDGFTFICTPADDVTSYNGVKYANALAAFNEFCTYSQDNGYFVGSSVNGGNATVTYAAQLERYNAFTQAVDACKATLGSGLNYILPSSITIDPTNYVAWIYSQIDLVKYLALPEVYAFGQKLASLTAADTDPATIIVTYGGSNYSLDGFWEQVVRKVVPMQKGAAAMADAVMYDETIWQGAVINPADKNQTTYDSDRYDIVYDLWVTLRENGLAISANHLKASEFEPLLLKLELMIEDVERVSLPYSSAQREAYENLKTYIPYYEDRLDRVTLAASKTNANYIALKALVDEANGYLALDWSSKTTLEEKDFPTAARMLEIASIGINGDCEIESVWQAMRKDLGLDRIGFKAYAYDNGYVQWAASGLYTTDSLQEAYETYVYYYENKIVNSTDAMAQAGLAEMQECLVLINPVTEPTNELKVNGRSLVFADVIGVQFKVDAAVMAEYSDVYMEFKNADGEVILTQNAPVGTETSTGKSIFQFDAYPQEGGDVITAVLHGTFGGKDYTASIDYGVATYIKNQWAKGKYYRLGVALLDYCAALQVCANYKTDDLCNADIPAAYRNEVPALDAIESVNDMGSVPANAKAEITKKGLVFGSKAAVNIKFSADDVTNLVLKVTINGETLEFTEFEYDEANSLYYVAFGDFYAHEYRTAFTATVYEGSTAVSNTMTYSVASYCASRVNNANALGNACKTLMVYGDAINALIAG